MGDIQSPYHRKTVLQALSIPHSWLWRKALIMSVVSPVELAFKLRVRDFFNFIYLRAPGTSLGTLQPFPSQVYFTCPDCKCILCLSFVQLRWTVTRAEKRGGLWPSRPGRIVEWKASFSVNEISSFIRQARRELCFEQEWALSGHPPRLSLSKFGLHPLSAGKVFYLLC